MPMAVNHMTLSGYDEPGEPHSSDAAPGQHRVRHHQVSSDGSADMDKGKEEPNEGGLGAVRIDEDCEADDTNGLSIESCLDSHTKPEY